MSLVSAFQDSLPELTALSLYPAEARYHCTPVEAVLLATIGVDGIHFCLLPAPDKPLAESPVLVISPLSEVEVIPVAETLMDFIALVITLKEAGAIEAAALREKDAFLSYLEGGLLGDSEHARQVNEAAAYCKQKFSVCEMENPYEYIQTIKQRYQTIRYTLPDCNRLGQGF